MGKDVKRILITGAAGQMQKAACAPQHAAGCIALCNRARCCLQGALGPSLAITACCVTSGFNRVLAPACEQRLCMVQARLAMRCAPRSRVGPCWAPTSPSYCTCWTLSLPSRAWRVSRWSSSTQPFPCCKASCACVHWECCLPRDLYTVASLTDPLRAAHGVSQTWCVAVSSILVLITHIC